MVCCENQRWVDNGEHLPLESHESLTHLEQGVVQGPESKEVWFTAKLLRHKPETKGVGIEVSQ